MGNPLKRRFPIEETDWLLPAQKLAAREFESYEHMGVCMDRKTGATMLTARQLLIDLLTSPAENVKVNVVCRSLQEGEIVLKHVHMLIQENGRFYCKVRMIRSMTIQFAYDNNQICTAVVSAITPTSGKRTPGARVYISCFSFDNQGMRTLILDTIPQEHPKYLRVFHAPRCYQHGLRGREVPYAVYDTVNPKRDVHKIP